MPWSGEVRMILLDWQLSTGKGLRKIVADRNSCKKEKEGLYPPQTRIA